MFDQRVVVGLVAVALAAQQCASAFVFPDRSPSLLRSPRFQNERVSHEPSPGGAARLRAAEPRTESANGAAALVPAAASGAEASRLASAFAALGEADQYEAVLTGLCAKILDAEESSPPPTADDLEDPISLLQEMNAKRVKARGRSLMSLIDATVATQDSKAMSTILSHCLKNGGVSRYGTLQSTLTVLPASPTARVRVTDGTMKTRQDRLKELTDLPVDDRGSEVTSALAFSAFCALCGFVNFFGLDDISPYANALLLLLVTAGTIDNFYDVISFATETSNMASKDQSAKLSLPEKGSLPLQLGTGQATGTVFRGLVRLSTVDTERESECEAAAFYAAYALGLPCFAFRPNALESAVLVVESMKSASSSSSSSGPLDPLLSSVGIMKLLVWLLAPVAMESSRHAQLIMSDPREARGLLERLEDKADLFSGQADLFWTASDQEKEDLLKWAYAEADYLLRQNRPVVTEISQRLAGGAATVGDCVAVIEEW